MAIVDRELSQAHKRGNDATLHPSWRVKADYLPFLRCFIDASRYTRAPTKKCYCSDKSAVRMASLSAPKITRNREFRACTECRKRKLKCDRQSPCAACSRRGEPASCRYHKRHQDEYSRHLRVESKLEHLEQLVQELSCSKGQLPSRDGRRTSEPSGEQHGGEDSVIDTLYNGPTHWSAMLEGIEELRNTMADSDDSNESSSDPINVESDGMKVLFGATAPLSYQVALSHFLPPKIETDRLVSAYFRARAVAAPFLHTAHFQRRYQRFWETPSATSPLWTSILFTILGIAASTLSRDSSADGREQREGNQFVVAAAHCLAIGQYYRPQRFGLEALILFAQAECLTGVDISPMVAILFGTIVRLATIMGYHRDPDRFRDKISAFEGEMRRRTWSLCLQLDMLISFQLGLPSNIQYPTWDTRPPTNILDSDFDEDTLQLPLPRLDSDRNEILFYIAKHKLMTVFEKIIRHTQSAVDRPVDEIEVIDRELRVTYSALPDFFKPRLMSDSILDPPSIIVTRICVTYIYHKCLCVLHRKHVVLGRPESMQICYSSASELVGLFLDIYQEFKPGGQLETQRWFMGGITWHGFLLGCTALCISLCSTRRFKVNPSDAAVLDIKSSLELLQSAKGVCEEQAGKSKDTQKVRHLIETTVLHFSNEKGGLTTLPPSLLLGNPLVQSDRYSRAAFSPSAQGVAWSDNNVNSLEDPTWAFMEQFVDFPNHDPTIIG